MIIKTSHKIPRKRKNKMKEQIDKINNDLLIIVEAIENGDTKDAIKMLLDVSEDLSILSLTC